MDNQESWREDEPEVSLCSLEVEVEDHQIPDSQ